MSNDTAKELLEACELMLATWTVCSEEEAHALDIMRRAVARAKGEQT